MFAQRRTSVSAGRHTAWTDGGSGMPGCPRWTWRGSNQRLRHLPESSRVTRVKLFMYAKRTSKTVMFKIYSSVPEKRFSFTSVAPITVSISPDWYKLSCNFRYKSRTSPKDIFFFKVFFGLHCQSLPLTCGLWLADSKYNFCWKSPTVIGLTPVLITYLNCHFEKEVKCNCKSLVLNSSCKPFFYINVESVYSQ